MKTIPNLKEKISMRKEINTFEDFKEVVLSHERYEGFVDLRCVLSSVLRFEYNFTLVSIAKLFNRDHTTIIHQSKKFTDEVRTYRNSELPLLYNEIAKHPLEFFLITQPNE